MKSEMIATSFLISIVVTIVGLFGYNGFRHSPKIVNEKVWILPDFNTVSQVAEVEVTAYDAYSSQSINVKAWRDGKTALNRPAIPGRTIAVDPRIIPFDSLVFIPGFGWRVAEDVGSAIKGYKIDILLENKGAAMRFGRKRMHILWIPPEVSDVKVNRKVNKAKSKTKHKTKSQGKKWK